MHRQSDGELVEGKIFLLSQGESNTVPKLHKEPAFDPSAKGLPFFLNQVFDYLASMQRAPVLSIVPSGKNANSSQNMLSISHTCHRHLLDFCSCLLSPLIVGWTASSQNGQFCTSLYL